MILGSQKMDNIINGKGFPGCKHTNESALQAIFSSITSLILIVHVLIMVSCFIVSNPISFVRGENESSFKI